MSDTERDEQRRSHLDLARARLSPGSVFDSPEQVVDHSALDHDQKVEILRQWELDALEDQVAEGEGMVGGGERPDFLRRIKLALARLSRV
jgi:hypothetical protein